MSSVGEFAAKIIFIIKMFDIVFAYKKKNTTFVSTSALEAQAWEGFYYERCY